VAAHVDIEYEPAAGMLEVDLVERARRGRLRGRDGLRLGDRGLRKQVLAVVEPGCGVAAPAR
jgi:hypothetical protein